MSEELPIAFLRRRLATMKTERSSWEPHWRECADFALPRRGRWFDDNKPVDQGKKKHQKIINGTATKAIRTFKAGLMSSHTSPAKPWFRLTTPDPALMEYEPVKQYLFLVERRLQAIIAKSNFYAVQPSVIEEMGVFGQMPMLIAEDLQAVVRMYAYTVGSYYLAANDRGEIDTLVREFKMTVRNVAAQFGTAGMSDNLRRLYNDQRRLDDWVDIVQFICPNTDMQYGRADYRGMAYRSCYFEANCGDERGDRFLKESGFREKPFVAPRWDITTPEDVYGSSIMMDVLGDCKELQFNEKRKAAGIDKLADPPWMAPPGLKNINLLPGSVTFLTSNDQAGSFKAAYEYPYQGVTVIGAENREIEQRIRDGFFESLLLVLSSREGPQMTAEEVVQIQGEKVAAIGPYLTRLNSEELDPLIDRVFEVAMRHPDRLLPPPPRELQGVALRVDYTSVLASAQKLVGAGSMERFLAVASGFAQFSSGVLDKIDFEQAVDELADTYGVPPSLVRSDDKVAELRQQRQQQTQMAQAAQMAQPLNQAAGAMKQLSEAEPTPESVLGRMGQATAAAQGVV